MIIISTPERFVFPVLQWRDDVDLWQVYFDYCFQWTDKRKAERRFTVPAGKLYNKASVPRPLWGIARTDGPWEAGSLMHDTAWEYMQNGGEFPAGMYQIKKDGVWVDCKRMTQAFSNDLLEYMGVLGGAGRFEAWKYKMAVSLYLPNWFKGFSNDCCC